MRRVAAVVITLVLVGSATAESRPRVRRGTFSTFVDPALVARRPPPAALPIVFVGSEPPNLAELRSRLARELGRAVMDRIATSFVLDLFVNEHVVQRGCERIVEERRDCPAEFTPHGDVLRIDLRCQASSPGALAAAIRARLAATLVRQQPARGQSSSFGLDVQRDDVRAARTVDVDIEAEVSQPL